MFEKYLNKFLSLIVLLRYGRMTPDINYYYRHTYRCQLEQLKYLFRDYFIKKPYKTIEFQGEFAPELEFTIPFAYWHYKNGTLKSTKSAFYTKEMYFFSPYHEDFFDVRTNEGNYNYELPRVLYSQNYNMSKWLEVPYKEYFKNDIYVYEKPILIIANRYNMEWGGLPISFYSLEDLDFMINYLKKDYTIIYNRPRPQNITSDTSEIYELNDNEWLGKIHPEVILMEDLYRENKVNANNYNHFQMLVYANCDKFISIHGGTAALASCFKGSNIILSKKGPEHHFGCFDTLFPKLSGATIYHAKTSEEARDFVLKYYVNS
ncbi:hypothetical protein ABID42_000513 [Arcicella rosea]|uniref:hypothetical protein n=1 Tax=Arcicella rosea TaxID=502909 RepID=UPI00345C673D